MVDESALVGSRWCIGSSKDYQWYVFFCTVELEHSWHQFITCPATRDIWKSINVIWMLISGVAKSPFSWVFAQVGAKGPLSQYHSILKYLRYWGLCFKPLNLIGYNVSRLYHRVFADRQRNLNHKTLNLLKTTKTCRQPMFSSVKRMLLQW